MIECVRYYKYAIIFSEPTHDPSFSSEQKENLNDLHVLNPLSNLDLNKIEAHDKHPKRQARYRN